MASFIGRLKNTSVFFFNLNLFFPFTQPFITLLLYSWVGRGARTKWALPRSPLWRRGERRRERKKEKGGRRRREDVTVVT